MIHATTIAMKPVVIFFYQQAKVLEKIRKEGGDAVKTTPPNKEYGTTTVSGAVAKDGVIAPDTVSGSGSSDITNKDKRESTSHAALARSPLDLQSLF